MTLGEIVDLMDRNGLFEAWTVCTPPDGRTWYMSQHLDRFLFLGDRNGRAIGDPRDDAVLWIVPRPAGVG